MRSATARPCYCGGEMNQMNLSIIGTGIGVTAIVVSAMAVVAGGINDHLATITGQIDDMNGRIDTTNGRIDALRSDVTAQIDGLRSDMREDHRDFSTRLRSVEVEFGKVEQRLETLERAVIPSASPAD